MPASPRVPTGLGRQPPTAIAGMAAALLVMAACFAEALRFPAVGPVLVLLLAAAAAAVAWRPAWALLILPAAMPVLDLAPLTGRVLWDEFDLLQGVLLPLVWLRTRGMSSAARAPLPPALWLALSLLAISLLSSLLRGGWPWPWPDANSLLSQHDTYNALRIGKGALWAAALVQVMRRLPLDDGRCHRLLGGGLCLGLTLTLAVVLWERAAFVGLGDFETDYRVTGPFSAMNTGGATIECFLAVGAAVAMAALLDRPQRWLRASLATLLVLTSYAVMVTYSRNGWIALLVVLAVMALALARQPQRLARRRRVVAGLALIMLMMLAASAPVLLGSYAQQRLATTVQDYAVRLAHWRDALALRDDDALTTVLGEGLGRYPELHLWRSAEPIHAGTFRWADGADGPLLRLGAGAPVYLEQWVDVGPGQQLTLSLRQRAPEGAAVGVALCEKWLLTSLQCATISPAPAPAPAASGTAAADWRPRRWRLDTAGWTASPTGLARPVKLALFRSGGAGALEISRVALNRDDGRPLLANGDFAKGLDRWFYATDVDPPWHIHSLPVTVLFDQGWFGLLAWSAVGVLALLGAARRAWRGDALALGVLAALLAFSVSGLVNSLIDTPRMLWLWCLLLWLGAAPNGAPPPRLGTELGRRP